MFHSIDLSTLRLCSILVSASFGVVFLSLWHRLRSDDYLLHWSGSSLLYSAIIWGFEALAPGVLVTTILCSLLGFSDILIISGVRRLAGKPAFRPWMMIGLLLPAAGNLIPALMLQMGSTIPKLVDCGQTIGLAAVMAIAGIAVLTEKSFPHSRGRRIAGIALLAYLPGYVIALLGFLGQTHIDLLALIPMLADQLLLGILNLGLLAIPAERAHDRMRDMAMRDPLTGAWNRAGLNARGAALIANGGALIAIDVDHFKAINDQHGHAGGDDVLAAISRRARQLAFPMRGEVFRVGGDEFIVLLPGVTLNEARTFANALRDWPEESALPHWTTSVGVTLARSDGASLEPALKRADDLLYKAKALGRDTITT